MSQLKTNRHKHMPQQTTEEIFFITHDKTVIEGTVFLPDEANGSAIICLHQLRLDRSTFFNFAETMRSRGYLVLVIDERGHGKSTNQNGEAISYETMSDGDFNKIPGMDIEEAINMLISSYKISEGKIGLVGASIGANATLISLGRDPRIAFGVALSPGMDYHGLQPENDVPQIQKPVLMVSSREDTYSFDSTAILFNTIASRNKEFLAFQDLGHGTNMFEADPSAENKIIEWILKSTS
ncbi:alpha/beta hydrolase [Patescibacteria group bacterium]